MSRHRLVIRCAVLGLAALASGCSGDLNPLRTYAQPEPKAPDFVAQSRKGEGDFLPVGVSAPARPIRAKSEAGTKALAAELERARSRNEAKGRSAESAARATGQPAAAQ